MSETASEPVIYRLGKKSNLWMEFTPSGHDGSPTWQMQITARNRGGGRITAILLETSALRPIATVRIADQSYPLMIRDHAAKRGGGLQFGGERQTGSGGGISWDMVWSPIPVLPNCFAVEMHVQAIPKSSGDVDLHLRIPLYQPDLWNLPAAAQRGHSAIIAHSTYNGQAAGFIMLDGALRSEADWDEERGGFTAMVHAHPLKKGAIIAFGVSFIAVKRPVEARTAVISHYAHSADKLVHPLASLSRLNPAAARSYLMSPHSYAVKGAERLYLKPPFWGIEELLMARDVFCAGAPHYPLDALLALWDWNRLHPAPDVPSVVRFGANGIATDFQVMGHEGESEPNKGAFWDKKIGDEWMDCAGEPTHGILANARIARALFLLHERTGEPLYRQAGLNVCQWLILKQNDAGYFDGERVIATRGRSEDGKFLPQPCSLDGVEAIRPFVLAYRATRNEVFINAAWKIANYLTNIWMAENESQSPVEAARAIVALAALDAEAPKPKLRAAMRDWAVRLRAGRVEAANPLLNNDGFYDGLYDCAEAAFTMYALDADPVYLRFAFYALTQIPESSAGRAWRSLSIYPTALLALTRLLPDAKPNFTTLSVSLGYWTFAPDAATDEFLHVQTVDGDHVDYLPLVCRENDALLIIALAPPEVELITILQHGKHPLVHDLLTGALESTAELQPIAGESWGRVGFFRIDP